MNQLSWLLYLADTADTAKTMAGLAGGVGGMAAVACLIGKTVTAIDYDFRSDDDLRKAWSSAFSHAWKIALIGAVLVTAIPSKSTLMLIAASEVGETVIASSAAQQIGGEAGALASDSLKLLHQYISDQLGKTVAPSR